MRIRLNFWRFNLVVISIAALALSCGHETNDVIEEDASFLVHDLFEELSEAIIYDGFAPPVASRIYAYCAIATYCSLTFDNELYAPLDGQLNGFSSIPKPDSPNSLNENIVLLSCFVEVGKSLVYRDFILDSAKVHLTNIYVPPSVSEKLKMASEKYGQELADYIIQWSGSDLYKETRNYPIHTVPDFDWVWQPTGPTYGTAIEPHWGELRTFFIDSITRDSCESHTPFSKDAESDFYAEALDVIEWVSNVDSEKVEIAKFWDCNPAPTDKSGRIAVARRQLTPGGHWVGIVKSLCIQTNKSAEESAVAYLKSSLAIADGFISAWKEKYRSNLIRPETFIKRYINHEWNPVLESPLFPEHPSAHSVVSAAAATVLSQVFGDTITYVDSVNLRFGPKPREFTTLIQAAEEAGMSRVYGGIHYLPAIEVGKNMGLRIGAYYNENLQITTENPSRE
jgi:hypothetical protein